MKSSRVFKTALVVLSTVTTLSLITNTSVATASVPQGASLSQGSFLTDEVAYHGHLLRTGLYLETGKLKACVLFLQGLGDSILNHEPLFRAMSLAGYRTISYDYYGQGGSSGDMNETRLDKGLASSRIKNQAKWMWNYFSTTADPVRHLSCAGSRRLVIGWSTGGLAAYELANERWAQGVALFAPGLNIKLAVGTSAGNWLRLSPWRLKANLIGGLPRVAHNDIITVASLTRTRWPVGQDPHIDEVKPTSPSQKPKFALNLIGASIRAHSLTIDPSVKGLVALSGKTDTYVDRDATLKLILKNAKHFEKVAYSGALHELDNELPIVQRDLFARTIRLFDSVR